MMEGYLYIIGEFVMLRLYLRHQCVMMEGYLYIIGECVMLRLLLRHQ